MNQDEQKLWQLTSDIFLATNKDEREKLKRERHILLKKMGIA